MATKTEQPTDGQLAALGAQNDLTLAEWWCELNHWGWPEGLPDPEPRPRTFADDCGRRSAVMKWIDNKVGHKFILRVHNKDMSDDVFESFWRNEREPGTPYGNYSARRVEQRMAALRAREESILNSDVILDDALDAEEIG